MGYSKLQVDIAVIGDGIAALSLAYLAAKNELDCVILGKNLPGATHAATGFLAPRPDYLLHDRELVRRTAHECNRWAQIFGPQIIKPKLFLIPIGPELPESVNKFEALLQFYDEETKERLELLPGGYFKIDRTVLEKTEPNLRKNYFDGALALWEQTVDPERLLKEMAKSARIVPIKEVLGFKVKNNLVQKVATRDLLGEIVSVSNEKRPLVVVNASGPWIPDIWKFFKISLTLELRIGIQAQVPGQYLKSGIITFGRDDKYVVCLQKDNYIQIGPTNGADDIGYLQSVFANLIEGPVPEASFLKSGYRLKPFVADTQRPVIWNHKCHGFDNLYSLHPGKMVLALLAADELLAQIKKDGWTEKPIGIPPKIYALRGEVRNRSCQRIRWFAVKSFVALVAYYLKFLLKPKPHN